MLIRFKNILIVDILLNLYNNKLTQITNGRSYIGKIKNCINV